MDGWDWKKLKVRYHKLTRFKVWVPYFKSDDRSRVISEIFPNKNELHVFISIYMSHQIIFQIKTKNTP